MTYSDELLGIKRGEDGCPIIPQYIVDEYISANKDRFEKDTKRIENYVKKWLRETKHIGVVTTISVDGIDYKISVEAQNMGKARIYKY